MSFRQPPRTTGMAEYIDINGVHTWYEERGEGDPLVLLHGGLTDSRDFRGNLDALASQFHIYLPERRGHGHTADVEGPLTLALMAQDTVAFLEAIVRRPAHLVGYSAGAAVALRTAVSRPDLVDKLVIVSGWFSNDGPMIRPSADAEPPPQLVAAYASVSPDGAEHFPAVIAKVAQAAAEEIGLTVTDLNGLGCETFVMVGDDDLVSLDHSVTLYRSLPNAQLAVVPSASHLLLLEKPTLCTHLVEEFLTTTPKPTMMPIRRANPRIA
jgi:pimeloyl-ACP methyl ester carboxylesterase